MTQPILVDVVRGQEAESRHLVDAVVVDADGSIVDSWGETDRLVMPRSAVKPIQALPLIDSGASAAFELDEVELALACASHNGEEAQVDRVVAWLHRIGLGPSDLECGPQAPIYEPANAELLRAGGTPGPEHNNCSGKHTGFLAVCRHLGLPTSGYIGPDHPLQRDHVTPALSDLCSVDLAAQVPAIDGCGIPVWRIPLTDLARGWARLVDLGSGRKLLAAMAAQPYFVAGSDRSCTRLMTDPRKPIAVKVGAEGVYCAVLPEDRIGVAVKVRDGAGRAAEVAVEHVLAKLGAVEDLQHPIHNWAGTLVGQLRVATP